VIVKTKAAKETKYQKSSATQNQNKSNHKINPAKKT
jgi:hypothetical protein